MAFIELERNTRTRLHVDQNEFVSVYNGALVCSEVETGTRTTIGHVRALKLNTSHAADEGIRLFDVCDHYGDDLSDLHAMLYARDSYAYKNAIAQRFNVVGSDLLVLDYAVIDPKWRRKKLGLLAVQAMVNLLGGGCGLAVSHIAPLRHDSHSLALAGIPPEWLAKNETDDARRRATVRLRKYLRRMGFKRLERTPYYALPLRKPKRLTAG